VKGHVKVDALLDIVTIEVPLAPLVWLLTGSNAALELIRAAKKLVHEQRARIAALEEQNQDELTDLRCEVEELRHQLAEADRQLGR
jgi:hypothetical protein